MSSTPKVFFPHAGDLPHHLPRQLDVSLLAAVGCANESELRLVKAESVIEARDLKKCEGLKRLDGRPGQCHPVRVACREKELARGVGNGDMNTVEILDNAAPVGGGVIVWKRTVDHELDTSC